MAQDQQTPESLRDQIPQQVRAGLATLIRDSDSPTADDKVKTWQFEPHTPTSFEVTFHYELLLPSTCDSECNCDSEEKESVLLQLPTKVDLSAKVPVICDPPGKIENKR